MSSFNRIAARPAGESANALIARIIAARPDLAHETFLVPSSGNTAITVMTVNEVFKGVTKGGNVEAFQREARFLQMMQSCTDDEVRIPRITWQADDGSVYAMARLRGDPLHVPALLSLPQDEQDRLAAALGRFNAAMARVATAEKRADAGLLPADTDRWTITPSHVSRALTSGANDRVWLGGKTGWDAGMRMLNYLRRSFDRQAQVDRLAVLHTDMHSENILYDRDSGTLSVLDLGGGDLVPPEYAFYNMIGEYPYHFIGETARAFAAAAQVDTNLARVNVFSAAFALKLSLEDRDEGRYLYRTVAKRLDPALDLLDGCDGVMSSVPAAPAPKAPQG